MIIHEKIEHHLQELEACGRITVKFGVPLSEYCTFRIGGIADIAVHPTDEAALTDVLSYFSKNEIPFVIIGNGSNVLFADEGVSGAVVFTDKLSAINCSGTVITAGAGAPLTLTSSIAGRNGLAGLEFAYGIPGSIGGAVFMNAGAYSGEMSDVVVETRCYNAKTGKIITVKGDEHAFGYRESCFKKNSMTILSTTIQLKESDPSEIKLKMNEYMRARSEKQPLEYPNAGSVFKRYPGYYTGKLIEDLGLKGYRIGGAEISQKHAGFIVNRDHATADDVLELIAYIKEQIKKAHGIELECEIRYIV